jgi:hypothetical protein
MQLIPFKCDSCHKNFCIRHRLATDHSCKGFENSGRGISNAGYVFQCCKDYISEYKDNFWVFNLLLFFPVLLLFPETVHSIRIHSNLLSVLWEKIWTGMTP